MTKDRVWRCCKKCGAEAVPLQAGGYRFDCDCTGGAERAIPRHVYHCSRLPKAERVWRIPGMEGHYQFVRQAMPATATRSSDETVALISPKIAGLFRRVVERRKAQ